MSKQKSIQATNLANLVIEKIKNKEPVDLQKLSVSVGYSKKSAIAQKGVQTKTYQSLVIPVIEKMKALQIKSIDALHRKDLDKEKVDSLVNLSKQMVHDTQLLSGKATENIANNIVVYGSDDFLALQVKKQ